MNYREEAEALENYLVDTRRHLHMNPELSFEEHQTTQFIASELEKLGLKPQTYGDYTGVYAIIYGGAAGNDEISYPKTDPRHIKTVALRADIDALPVEEQNDVSYKSLKSGVMHACGHDCHTSMLLSAARLLMSHRDSLKGNVKLLFQAAEESCHGAEYYVRHGFLDDVDAIYGAHVSIGSEVGFVNAEAGARMASVDNFTIQVNGTSAHGATPFAGNDAIVAAAAMILQLQTVVSRKNDPRESLVVTIGELNGGQRFNIIANKVVMKGTIRTHSPEARAKVESWMKTVIDGIAAANGVTADFTYDYYAGPLINDESLTEIAQGAFTKLYGPEGLYAKPQAMGSEDFSYFTDGTGVPGMYTFIGCRNEEKGITADHHNDHFDVDERCLTYGTAMYAQFAEDYLNQE